MKNTSERTIDERALHDLFQQLVDGWKQGSGQSFAANFSEDADFIVWTGMHLKGRQAIADAHQQIFDTFYKGSRLESQIKDIRFLSAEIALLFVQGRVILPEGAQNAQELGRQAVQMFVALKQAGGWSFTAFQNTHIHQWPGQ